MSLATPWREERLRSFELGFRKGDFSVRERDAEPRWDWKLGLLVQKGNKYKKRSLSLQCPYWNVQGSGQLTLLRRKRGKRKVISHSQNVLNFIPSPQRHREMKFERHLLGGEFWNQDLTEKFFVRQNKHWVKSNLIFGWVWNVCRRMVWQLSADWQKMHTYSTI